MGTKILFDERYKMLLKEYGENKVLKSIKHLNDKCQKIVNMYFGLNGESKKTLKEINEIMNIKDSHKWMYYSLQRMKSIIDRNFKYNTKNSSPKISNKKLMSIYISNQDRETYLQIMYNNFKLIDECIEKSVILPNMTKEEIAEEFFSVGCIGLHNAINSFSKEENSFTKYAKKCICEELVKEIKKYQNDYVYLDEVIDINVEDEIDCIEKIIEEDYNRYVNKKINEALSTRCPKTRLVIECYYGLNGRDVMNERAISEQYKISYAFIKSIISKTNAYLKNKLEDDLYVRNKKVR